MAHTYDCQIRVTGVRDGWTTTLMDSPTLTLESNPQFGSIISSEEQAEKMLRTMVAGLLQDGDEVHVTVTARD